jgi:hypothetical protein
MTFVACQIRHPVAMFWQRLARKLRFIDNPEDLDRPDALGAGGRSAPSGGASETSTTLSSNDASSPHLGFLAGRLGLLGKWFSELCSRQGALARTGAIYACLLLPLALAFVWDDRQINDINIWVKPIKFFVSMILYWWTLAWFFGYVPRRTQSTVAGRFVVYAPIVIGSLELLWLVAAAVAGVPSHFNRTSMLWQMAYLAAGVGALVLLLAVLVQGILIARQREIAIAPALRHSLVLGSLLAFAGTLVCAGYLASQPGHWVGAVTTDANGLPILGWSRTGGDLRVAHFWALHSMQALPLFGWLAARALARHRPLASVCVVWLAAGLYAAFTLSTFAQALRGEPFLALP